VTRQWHSEVSPLSCAQATLTKDDRDARDALYAHARAVGYLLAMPPVDVEW
jgi:hypothetical protein